MSQSSMLTGHYECGHCEREVQREVHPLDIISPPACPECGHQYTEIEIEAPEELKGRTR